MHAGLCFSFDELNHSLSEVKKNIPQITIYIVLLQMTSAKFDSFKSPPLARGERVCFCFCFFVFCFFSRTNCYTIFLFRRNSRVTHQMWFIWFIPRNAISSMLVRPQRNLKLDLEITSPPWKQSRKLPKLALIVVTSALKGPYLDFIIISCWLGH